MEKRSISVIGTGALGSVLTRALASAHFPIASLFNHHKESARLLGARIDDTKTGRFPETKEELGNVVFLTVPDRHIRDMANQLSTLTDNFNGFLFLHCSGNKSSALLRSLQQKGAAVASFHPLQTFTKKSQPSDFNNIYVDIEGDKRALSYLTFVCKELNCCAMEITPEAKPYLHAAAVMASNNLVALVESASQIAELGGIEKDKTRQALMPLINKSLQNISGSQKLSGALSGPLARGDISTIADHLALLEQNQWLLALYKQLGHILLNLSEQDDLLSNQQCDQIRMLFDEE